MDELIRESEERDSQAKTSGRDCTYILVKSQIPAALLVLTSLLSCCLNDKKHITRVKIGEREIRKPRLQKQGEEKPQPSLRRGRRKGFLRGGFCFGFVAALFPNNILCRSSLPVDEKNGRVRGINSNKALCLDSPPQQTDIFSPVGLFDRCSSRGISSAVIVIIIVFFVIILLVCECFCYCIELKKRIIILS